VVVWQRDAAAEVGDTGGSQLWHGGHCRRQVKRAVAASDGAQAPDHLQASGIASGIGGASFIAMIAAATSRAASPHGIHPTPNRASLRTTRGFTVPDTQIGTPCGRTGLGIMWMASKLR
jgi:hypothetical protein